MVACQTWIFGFTDGWSSGTCLRWFTAVYKWRSAGTDRAKHNPLASSQNNHSWAQTSIHKHTSMHTAAGQTAVENIWRGPTPTCQCSFMLCLHFPRESTLVRRSIHLLVLQMQSTEPAKTYIWLRFLSVLASSSSLAGRISWIHTRRKHRISILSCTQWTNSGANDLLTYMTVSCHIIYLVVWSEADRLYWLCLRLLHIYRIMFTNNLGILPESSSLSLKIHGKDSQLTKRSAVDFVAGITVYCYTVTSWWWKSLHAIFGIQNPHVNILAFKVWFSETVKVNFVFWKQPNYLT